MRTLSMASVVFLTIAGVASAAPFQEITFGIPVPSLDEAEAWYVNFLGSETETIKPTPGVLEFKAAPGVWIQLFETDSSQSSGAIIRFLVDDLAVSQDEYAKVGIDTGEAVEIPNVVTFSEFADPFGNAIGLYDLP